MKRNTPIDFNLTEILNAVLHKYNSTELVPAEKKVEALMVWSKSAKRMAVYDGTLFREFITASDLDSMQNLFQWKDDADIRIDADILLTVLIPGYVTQGVTLALNHRLLLSDLSDPRLNGVYVVTASGAIRAEDMNSSAEFTNTFITVKSGTYANRIYRCKTANPVLGTDNITFGEFLINNPSSSESTAGLIMLATLAEVIAGSNDTKAITPLKLKAITDVINAVITKLKPGVPTGLSGKQFTSTHYTALAADTGSLDKCTKELRPEVLIDSSFFDGDSGTILAEIDGVQSGTKALSTGDDSGTYDSMIIVSDIDAYEGMMGQEGFYKVLTAKIVPAADLAVGMHTFQLKHSSTGDSVLYELFVDNPGVATISNASYTPTPTTRYISGVPSLEYTENIRISFDIVNAVKKHYNEEMMGVIELVNSPVVKNIPLPITHPAENAVVPVVDYEIPASEFIDEESHSVNIIPYNASSEAGTPTTLQIPSRTDHVSDESARKTAGIGHYPASGYGGAWNPALSLKDLSLVDELQMLNGFYQRPAGNYTTNVPAGPNYDEGMGIEYKYCIPIAVSLPDAVSGFDLLLEGADCFSQNLFGSDNIRIQVKVEGSTGWLNANSPIHPEVAPLNDGDSCAIQSECTATKRRISFGQSSYSGTLFVRIGLPTESTLKFSGVQLQNLSNEYTQSK